MSTVRQKPCVKISSSLREEINLIADKEEVGRNEMLETIVRMGLVAYHAKTWASMKTG